MKVFCGETVGTLVEAAERFGLNLLDPVNLSCGDRIVTWNGLDYSFLFLAFQKTEQTQRIWEASQTFSDMSGEMVHAEGR
jgi:hypothetical protein